MRKLTLPKWAVVKSADGGRMIHIGNGEFISADAQTPKAFEGCIPRGQVDQVPGVVETVDAPEYVMEWAPCTVTVSQDGIVAQKAPDTAYESATLEVSPVAMVPPTELEPEPMPEVDETA